VERLKLLAVAPAFDVLIARGGHHTNQIMKVLTLTSVILLRGGFWPASWA
jgi:hypothetical protein